MRMLPAAGRLLFDTRLLHTAMLVMLIAMFPAERTLAAIPLNPAQKEYLTKLDEPIILRGDFFRAVMAAYEDFGKLLRKRAQEAPTATNQMLTERLSKVDNFDINVERSEGTIVVEFVVTVRGGHDPVFGGGARYIIDGTTFAITEKIYSK